MSVVEPVVVGLYLLTMGRASALPFFMEQKQMRQLTIWLIVAVMVAVPAGIIKIGQYLELPPPMEIPVIDPGRHMTTQTIMTRCETMRAIEQLYIYGLTNTADLKPTKKELSLLNRSLALVQMKMVKECAREQPETFL